MAFTPSSSLSVRNTRSHSASSIHGMPSFAKLAFSTLPRVKIFTPFSVSRCPSVPTVRKPNRMLCVNLALASFSTSV